MIKKIKSSKIKINDLSLKELEELLIKIQVKLNSLKSK